MGAVPLPVNAKKNKHNRNSTLNYFFVKFRGVRSLYDVLLYVICLFSDVWNTQ